jgi:diamine N-acetyltransferase
MDYLIIEITDRRQIGISANIIRKSFATVAKDFNLTRENCPTHASFTTDEQLDALHKKGLQFFGLFVNGEQLGFVATEKGEENTYYMEKLAVLPGTRRLGYGEQLVNFAAEFASCQGASKLSIGTIHEHVVLKEWYQKQGFVEIGLKKFGHLPFTVCFMEKDLRR